jgi:Asp-tRNA(Asn)/Glu-tRNA(Gln) amidotransferase A subunit family amidase
MLVLFPRMRLLFQIGPMDSPDVRPLQPTWGAISREGLSQYSVTTDTLGFFSRSVADLELLSTIFQLTIDQPLPTEPFSLQGARIAFCKTPAWSLVGPGTRNAWATGQALLSQAGASVLELTLPDDFANVKRWHLNILASEGRVSFLGSEFQSTEKDISFVLAIQLTHHSLAKTKRLSPRKR